MSVDTSDSFYAAGGGGEGQLPLPTACFWLYPRTVHTRPRTHAAVSGHCGGGPSLDSFFFCVEPVCCERELFSLHSSFARSQEQAVGTATDEEVEEEAAGAVSGAARGAETDGPPTAHQSRPSHYSVAQWAAIQAAEKAAWDAARAALGLGRLWTLCRNVATKGQCCGLAVCVCRTTQAATWRGGRRGGEGGRDSALRRGAGEGDASGMLLAGGAGVGRAVPAGGASGARGSPGGLG